MIVRRVAEDQPRYGDGGCGSAERRGCDVDFKSLVQLFEYEDRSGQRRIERGGKTCARPRCDQRAGIRPTASCELRQEMSCTAPHLHARSFSTQRKAGADREHAASEFNRDETQGRRGADALRQHCFNIRNSASRCTRRDAVN